MLHVNVTYIREQHTASLNIAIKFFALHCWNLTKFFKNIRFYGMKDFGVSGILELFIPYVEIVSIICLT